ncbi:c-type cytochrome [Mesobacterium pallidum]|uniref:c-type cytochrome n=1 Tax=Mesobacterium pallidum TaxID=2872037 RepID=UPI001EE33077|nr:cytochrome c [Mesobacterium pallidum]
MKARFTFGLAAVLSISGLVGAVVADSHVDPAIAGAIKARQAQMTLYAFNLGTLGAMARGNAPYDAEAATAAATNLQALTGLNASALWPAGSDSESVDGTRALPALWQNFPDVIEKAQATKAAADAMVTAAGTDLAALQGAMGALGGACGDCHKAYRLPDE